MNMLSYDFMQRALLAAAIVGVLAPVIGVFLVQRRLALLGDGMGHVALTGVGLSFLLGTQPVVTALVVAIAGAVVVELIRTRSRTVADVALALVFYGGIAGGVLLTSLAPGSSSTALNQYLFGSLATVAASDVAVLAGAAMLVVVVVAAFGKEMFAVSLDPDFAHVQGIQVKGISLLTSVLAAVTVVIGMRTVGLLLVAAIMIVPVAAANQFTRSFVSTMAVAVGFGAVSSVAGLVGSFYLEVPSGPAIVLLALALFLITAAAVRLLPGGRGSA
jgi:zinc transport system permease protein